MKQGTPIHRAIGFLIRTAAVAILVGTAVFLVLECIRANREDAERSRQQTAAPP